MHVLRPLENTRRTYCAGPLFNDAERAEMMAIAEQLRRAGFYPFVPHDDGMEFVQVQPELIDRGLTSAEAGRLAHAMIFALDVYHVICGCGSLVLNLNGRVPDEGAVAEAAMAWSFGKPLVIFKNDGRSKIAGRDNPLVAGLAQFTSVSKLEQLPAALEAAIEQCASKAAWETSSPPHVTAALQLGEQVWEQLGRLDRPSASQVAEVVLRLRDSAAAIDLLHSVTQPAGHGTIPRHP